MKNPIGLLADIFNFKVDNKAHANQPENASIQFSFGGILWSGTNVQIFSTSRPS